MNNKISVVIPVYNAAMTLQILIDRLMSVLSKISSDFEVILVNDGSQDDSWRIIQEVCERFPYVVGINLMRNYGQHNALLAGIREARNEITVTMDDDLQNPPEEIEKMLKKLEKGFDVVYGTPQKQKHGFWRNFASLITKLALQSTMGVETARKVSAFRVFRTKLRDAFESYQSPYVSIDVLLTWGTISFGAVSVRQDLRGMGRSNYSFRKLLIHALNMMTGFSIRPLQITSIIGFCFTFFGLVVLVVVILRYLIEGVTVPGFPFLASIIAIFSGAQLFALGIIGEYLARIHFRTMERPPYVIGKRTVRKG